MKKSILTEIIQSCQKKELRDIERWLLSPAHNTREDVILLFRRLISLKTEDDSVFAKEAIWPHIFPKQPYDDAYMRQVIYFLTKSVEDCLSFRELSKKTVTVSLALAHEYRLRQLEKPFRQTLNAARKSMEENPFRDSTYFLDKFYLEQEEYFYRATQKRSTDLNLQEVSDEFDLAFIANKLRIACRMLSHQTVYKKAQYEIGLLEGILAHVEAKNLTEIPAVAVYYYGYKALTEKSELSHFDNLQRIILQHDAVFPEGEKREISLLAINYCIGKMNAGDKSFSQKAFDLFKPGFEKMVFLENGILSRFTFGNAVAVALAVREFDWVERFIEQFQTNLEEKYRKSTVHIAQSRLYFEKKDYDRAQELLAKFDYDDMLLNLVAKTMLLKIYYENRELEAFESLLEAMRSYLQRKEALAPNHKAVFKNLISLMKKLIHLNPYSKTQKEKFRNLVLETNPLIEREWFLNLLR